MLAVGVEHLEDAHVRLVNGEIVPLFEGESIELIGRVEDAVLEHIVELEIGLHLRIVEIVTRFADLLGVEVPVPGLELEATLLGVDDGLNVVGVAARLWRLRPGRWHP